MAEQGSNDGAKKPSIDIVRDLKGDGQKLSLHLKNGESLTGKIAT